MNDEISLDRKILTNVDNASSKEWLVWNGKGGYASSTTLGLNTRKYHGLLVAPMNPPWDRKLFLSKIEEEITFGGEKFELSTNRYPDTVHPKGYKHIDSFCLNPFPTFSFSPRPEISIEKEVFMPYGYNAVVVRYEIEKKGQDSAKLRLFPLVNNRDLDSLGRSESFMGRFDQEKQSRDVELIDSRTGEPVIFMGSDRMEYIESELSEDERWYKDMVYPEEKERGYEYREDLYNPGFFETEIGEGANTYYFSAAAGPEAETTFNEIYSDPTKSFETERERTLRRLKNICDKPAVSEVLKTNKEMEYLVQASDSFIVENNAILAGYHWFSTWGRDALIALPGLTLVPGRYDLAREILSSFLSRTVDGIIPNRFWGEEVEINSSDASLFFFDALYKYVLYTGDIEFVDENWNEFEKIIKRYSSSSGDVVEMDDDGLVSVDGGTTWMDAKVDGRPVTPRDGKPVDVNALWYNALRVMEVLAEKIERDFEFEMGLSDVRRSFLHKFWNPEAGYLNDVVYENDSEDSLRPNQLMALSQSFPLLSDDKARKVIEKVREKLLTSRGLRSLSRDALDYHGRYKGNQSSRDLAYHQGTVWSWLIGPYVTALCRFEGEEGRARSREFLESFINDHLEEAGLGTVSEVFDGDEPHSPGGCVSQAWSVAEVLRSYFEDVKGIRPPCEEEYPEG